MAKSNPVTDAEIIACIKATEDMGVEIKSLAERLQRGDAETMEHPINYARQFSFIARAASELVSAILSVAEIQKQKEEFIEKALELTQPKSGFVAMLLRSDYDSAATRKHLFADCKIFAKKITLTKRIVWFKRTDGKKEAPSENHCWMIWDWTHKGPPTIEYAP